MNPNSSLKDIATSFARRFRLLVLSMFVVLAFSGSFALLAAESTAEQFAALPTDIGDRFIKASLTEASTKALAMPTPDVPAEKYRIPGAPAMESVELNNLLKLTPGYGPVTREEIAALEEFLLAHPLPRCGMHVWKDSYHNACKTAGDGIFSLPIAHSPGEKPAM